MNTCTMLHGYRERERELFESRDLTPFLFVGLDKERNLQKQGGHTKRIAPSHFGCCCQHRQKREDQLRRTTRYLQTRGAKRNEVDGWDFRTFIVNCDKSIISV